MSQQPAAKRAKLGEHRRGGIRQRIAKAEDEDPVPEHVESNLANFLLSMFAWGNFSPQHVQKIAKLAVQDMKRTQEENPVLEDLEKLAKIGVEGQYPNKRHEDLMKQCQTLTMLPPLFYTEVPFKAPLGYCEQGFLLPHEMFAAIYHKYPATWQKAFLPGTDTLQDFWHSVRDHPQMHKHPLVKRTGYAQKAIPLGLHGDDVPITGIGKVWAKLMTVFSFTSLIASGQTKDTQFYIWSVFRRICNESGDANTYDCFFKIMEWSFYWLYEGVWPKTPWDSNVPCFGNDYMFLLFFVLSFRAA